ncbi:EutN/CcmL family microcompartment protein [candidate division CSSED10-310 bacterium]|uniref:EutN/CcmL family microcompartment protein n=1 Tax=candidate division CSSED10-310 bacterium TaxID=2855610 RepID=A0ABV6Z3V1_UNCC1
MNPGLVVGRVVATQKYHSLIGTKLLLIQPTDWQQDPHGDPLIAVDTVGAGAEEFVFYVSSREAAVAHKEIPPIDAAVVGIIDGVHLEE